MKGREHQYVDDVSRSHATKYKSIYGRPKDNVWPTP